MCENEDPMGNFTFVMLGFIPRHITSSDPAFSLRPSCEYSGVHISPKVNIDFRAYDTHKIYEVGYFGNVVRVERTV